MIELLAVLSASAAAGMRVALPLLLVVLYGGNLWYQVPLLSHISPQVGLAVLVVWSLIELVFSKDRIGLRILQIVQLLFSPVVGAIMGVAVARITGVSGWLVDLMGAIGGLLALVLKLVQVGWFYRLKSIPVWVLFAEDTLCILLVLFALDAPKQGGLIALLLLWLALRSSKEWYRWYTAQAGPSSRKNPRRYKQDPD
ncbi:DUF4126 domain-containing protein [Kovacikia minuta CCNUW1]|uniref:DUF4126 domain-containing protein n=1 Tax=Kovacikia minuta TaxID=2931930 RepID=UPI001CCC40FA|nr:DUF4126 domain-containing protein [Kovacikia minuta]UBF28369.1 DUF4126 domain-containing protein [Kovacikia minuta CCNUW1]